MVQSADLEGKEDLLQLHDFREEIILLNIKKRY